MADLKTIIPKATQESSSRMEPSSKINFETLQLKTWSKTRQKTKLLDSSKCFTHINGIPTQLAIHKITIHIQKQPVLLQKPERNRLAEAIGKAHPLWEDKGKGKFQKVPIEEHLLKPSRVTTAVRMNTNGNKKARIRIVWNSVRYEMWRAATLIFIKAVPPLPFPPLPLDIVILLILGEKCSCIFSTNSANRCSHPPSALDYQRQHYPQRPLPDTPTRRSRFPPEMRTPSHWDIPPPKGSQRVLNSSIELMCRGEIDAPINSSPRTMIDLPFSPKTPLILLIPPHWIAGNGIEFLSPSRTVIVERERDYSPICCSSSDKKNEMNGVSDKIYNYISVFVSKTLIITVTARLPRPFVGMWIIYRIYSYE